MRCSGGLSLPDSALRPLRPTAPGPRAPPASGPSMRPGSRPAPPRPGQRSSRGNRVAVRPPLPHQEPRSPRPARLIPALRPQERPRLLPTVPAPGARLSSRTPERHDSARRPRGLLGKAGCGARWEV